MEQMIKATVLIENTSDSSLACEHGLSILIEFEGKRILLDAGSSEAFCANADALCETIRQEGIERVYTGHCTGDIGFQLLKDRLGEVVQRLTTGLVVVM